MDSEMISKEWASRPMDQRFLTVEDLHNFNLQKRQNSAEKGVALDHCRVLVNSDGDLLLNKGDGVGGARMNNWSFGQVCQRANAPAGYLRSLPAELAAIPLQWSLEQKREDAKLYLGRFDNGWTLKSATSESYGRIFDADMTDALIKNLDLNMWKVPSASYATKDPKRATTLYASDRDCFVALVDDSRHIMEPGTNSPLYRGMIVRNSEVGAATFEMILFLYRTICDNRIIWGGQELSHLKIRHSSGAPMRFIKEAQPQLQRYLEAGTQNTVETIAKLQGDTIGDTSKDVQSWLQARGFTKSQAKTVTEKAELEPGNPRSRWNVIQGITSMAQDCPFGDERLDVERMATKLM